MSTPLSLKLLADGVVASYIHEISARHRAAGSSTDDGATDQSAGERVSAPAAG